MASKVCYYILRQTDSKLGWSGTVFVSSHSIGIQVSDGFRTWLCLKIGGFHHHSSWCCLKHLDSENADDQVDLGYPIFSQKPLDHDVPSMFFRFPFWLSHWHAKPVKLLDWWWLDHLGVSEHGLSPSFLLEYAPLSDACYILSCSKRFSSSI